MADLSELMKYAPTVGAGFAGINQRQSEMESDLKRQELAELIQSRMADAQRKQAMQPYELEKARLANMQTQGNIDTTNLTNQKTRGTMDSEMDATNTKNKMEAYKTIGGHLGSLSEGLDESGVPPHMALAQRMQDLGIPPQAQQQLMRRYSSVPPAQLSKRLKEDGERILRETSQYAQAYDTSAMTNDAHILTNAATNRTQKEIEQARIEAGKYDRSKAAADAEQQMDVTVQKAIQKGARAGHAAMVSAAEFFRQNGMPDKAAKYTAMAEQIRPQAEAETQNLSPKPGSVNIQGVTGGSVPVNPSLSIAPPGATQSGHPQAAAPGYEAAAKAAWGSYEPNKYEYRVGPNGKLQRKAK